MTFVKIAKRNIFIIILLSVFLCNFFSCKIAKKINEINEIIKNDGSTHPEPAIINSDAEYSLYVFNPPHGVLSKGENVLVLNDRNCKETKDGSFDVYVKIRTTNGNIKGYVNEKYLTYNYNRNHDLWCKNILLTRDYYYQGTIDDIYNIQYSGLLKEGLDRDESISFMCHFFSEARLFFSASSRYLVIGDSNYCVSFYILSLIKESDNTYSIMIQSEFNEIYDLILFVDDNSITIKDMKKTSGGQYTSFDENFVSYRYIPYDANKSKPLKDNILLWAKNNYDKND